jgi:perosamine synthetase
MTSQVGTQKAWMNHEDNNIVLFYPFVPKSATPAVEEVLSSRWIGQGPKVDQFEFNFNSKFNQKASIAVGSGTDALHLAYLLAGIMPGDEVICPVFTCTATNLPLLYIGATPIFADIDPLTMNISPKSIRDRITDKTKAIVTVDYAGLPCDYDEILEIAKEFDLVVIDDAAHAVGATYKGQNIGAIADFTTYSFQAIKHITTGDGGLLSMRDESRLDEARRLRWFGIDRVAKQNGIWANDIVEVGYKYQMTDIGAAIGLAGLKEFDDMYGLRKKILEIYFNRLRNVSGLYNVGIDSLHDRSHAAWMHTVLVDDREKLQEKLRENSIESAQVHYRNDMYSIFGGRRKDLPNMDLLENKYLVLPIHPKMSIEDANRVCDVVISGW